MLVVDASMALDAITHEGGWDVLAAHEVLAPPLLWSEVTSTLHEALWRGAITRQLADEARQRLATAPVARRSPARLGAVAWVIADDLGLAKTYDAEYLALARIVGCQVVTTDARLRRGADRLGLVLGPTEL